MEKAEKNVTIEKAIEDIIKKNEKLWKASRFVEKDKSIFSEVAVAGGVPFLRPGFPAGDLPFLQEKDQPACGGGAPVYEVRSASCRE